MARTVSTVVPRSPSLAAIPSVVAAGDSAATRAQARLVPGPSPARVAIAVADADLRLQVQRLAAIAGVSAAPVADLATVWQGTAPLVVDADVAQATRVTPIGRREGLLVVSDRDPPVEVWQAAVALGAEAVAVLPRDEHGVTTWIAATGEPASRGRLLCCVGLRGGVGASTLAAAVALAAARDSTALLVDLDPSAGGIDLVLGVEQTHGARWDGFAAAAGTVSADALATSVPSLGALRVLSCSPGQAMPSADASHAVLTAGLRGADLVVVDLPAGATPQSERALAVADAAVVLVPAEVRAVTAAAALLPAVARLCRDLRLVVRHPGPGDLRPRDVSSALGLDVTDVWPWDRRLGRIIDTGSFARGWRRTSVAGPAQRLATAMASS